MAELKAIAEYLDELLKINEFTDSSNNGLQVESQRAIKKVCCGVDASLAFFREAHRRGADLLICHHGLSWGDSLKRITGLNYRRLAFLLEHGMALYASHLPLDAHPRYGNNAQIVKALGLAQRKPFGMYQGQVIGFSGLLPKPMRYDSFKKLASRVIGSELQTMDYGRKTVRSVAVVSGGGAGEIEEAAIKDIDVFLSGEPALVAHTLAQDYGINAVFAGHYATEVFGVRALVGVLRRRFHVDAEFVDLGVGF